jgi:hypothetical protein
MAFETGDARVESEHPEIFCTIKILKNGDFHVIHSELGRLVETNLEEVKKRLSNVEIKEIMTNSFFTFLEINSGCALIGKTWL